MTNGRQGNAPAGSGKTVGVILRSAEPGDFDEILKLNEDLVHFLSPMDCARLEHLDAQSALHRVAEKEGAVLGFCLAFREGADYDSVNYRWFAEHYPRFLYVDRVVVSTARQAGGLGSLFYEDVFRTAREMDVPLVTAEIDIKPPNPVSLAFHEKFGFREVGTQRVADGKKIVSLQIAEV